MRAGGPTYRQRLLGGNLNLSREMICAVLDLRKSCCRVFRKGHFRPKARGEIFFLL
jgi:hypothetical protein